MKFKKIIKEYIKESYRIIEYDDGSIEEILDFSLLENNLTEEEKAQIQEQSNISSYRTLSKSDKQNLSVKSQLSYIETLLEHLINTII